MRVFGCGVGILHRYTLKSITIANPFDPLKIRRQNIRVTSLGNKPGQFSCMTYIHFSKIVVRPALHLTLLCISQKASTFNWKCRLSAILSNTRQPQQSSFNYKMGYGPYGAYSFHCWTFSFSIWVFFLSIFINLLGFHNLKFGFIYVILLGFTYLNMGLTHLDSGSQIGMIHWLKKYLL